MLSSKDPAQSKRLCNECLTAITISKDDFEKFAKFQQAFRNLMIFKSVYKDEPLAEICDSVRSQWGLGKLFTNLPRYPTNI